MNEAPYNRLGLKAMIHHVARRYAMEPQKLGAVKLHKVLWNTEIQLLRRGYPEIGESFIKMPFGPCSEHLEELVQELIRERRLAVMKPAAEYETTTFVGKGEPDRGALSADQWRVLDQVAERIVEDHTATSISERSHGPVWDAVELREAMPAAAAALQWIPTPDAVRTRMLERLDH